MEDLVEEFEKVVFPPKLPNSINLEGNRKSCHGYRRKAVTKTDYSQLCDDNGRIVDEHSLKEAIFRGGIEPDLRKTIWPFLFGMYSFSTTERERSAMFADYCSKYCAMKKRWEIFLRSHQDAKIHSPQYLESIDKCKPSTSIDNTDPALQQQMQCLFIQAEVFAGRQPFDLANLAASVRVIDKDVPRTDRTTEYFSGATNVHLRMLRHVLVTYAAFHPEVGYAQGMNDIVARFLVVFDSEEIAYWCLVNYMEHMKIDFVEDGMLSKLKLVRQLLLELDRDLLEYLDALSVGDLTFCHRWMLLGFKREFELEDSLRCFEILSSRHLELSSLEAQKTQEGEAQRDFEHTEGTNRVVAAPNTCDFSFEVFLCATILMLHRARFFQCQDTSDVFCFIATLTLNLNLDMILEKSESLFYTYCKKSVTDCFQLIELPSPEQEGSKELQMIDTALNTSKRANRSKELYMIDTALNTSKKS